MANEPNVFKSQTVYTRQLWGDAWSVRTYLRATQFSFACGPDTSDARLEYKYGNIQRNDQNNFAIYDPLDLSDRYVKIVVDGGPTWYGIVIDQENQRSGESVKNGNEEITGTQTFYCRGLEYLLQRKPIDSSIVKTAAGEDTIKRGVGFNLGGGLPSSADKLPNMNAALGARSFIFAQSLDTANSWDAYAILEYLVNYHRPEDKNGLDSFGWTINNAQAFNILGPYIPAINVHGKSFFHILNELIDRRRLMGWYVYVDPVLETPQIRVFTFNANPIALPSGVALPANTNQTANWDFDQENLVQQFVLASDDASKFDRVIARGEPKGGCFTVSIQNGLLETDWSAASQALYNAGDPAAAAIADPYERMAAHQAARNRDETRKVYRYFRIATTFDGYVGINAVWPQTTLLLFTTEKSWWPGLRLQDRLPLRLEHDYQNPAAVTNAMKTSSKWEYQRPFVYVAPLSGRAEFIDRMSRGRVDEYPENGGRSWSCSMRMQDDAFGIIVDVHGAPQHVMADNTFAAVDLVDEVSYEGEVDYSYMYATVFAEGDACVEEIHPFIVAANPDTLKELIIDVPGARLDYLVPGTTIGIDESGVVVQSLGGYVRDDTEYLKDVARTAFEWYSQPRKSISVTIRDLAETRVIGELVLAIGGANNAETINSVVTKSTYDMRAGTATYMTQFAELDLA